MTAQRKPPIDCGVRIWQPIAPLHVVPSFVLILFVCIVAAVSDGDGLGKVMVISFVVGMWLSSAVFYVGIGYAMRAIRLPVHPLFRDIEELLLREYAIIPTFVAFLARSAGLAGLESFFGLAAIHICTGGEPDIPPRHAQIGMVLMLLVHAVCVYPRIRGHVRSLTEVQE